MRGFYREWGPIVDAVMFGVGMWALIILPLALYDVIGGAVAFMLGMVIGMLAMLVFVTRANWV